MGTTWILGALEEHVCVGDGDENKFKRLKKDGNKGADLLENGLEDMGKGKGKLGKSERVAWTYIHYQM